MPSQTLTVTYVPHRPQARAVLIAEFSRVLGALSTAGSVGPRYAISSDERPLSDEELHRALNTARRVLDGDTHMLDDGDLDRLYALCDRVLGER